MNFLTSRISLDVYFSYNARKVTVVDSLYKFGQAIMNPDLSGQSFSAMVIVKTCRFAGLIGSFQVGNNLWKIDSVTTIPAAPILARAGIRFRPFDLSDEGKTPVRCMRGNMM